VAEPRNGAHDEPHLAQGDVHEGAHESRVELRAGAAGDFRSPLGSGCRLFVRAGGRDDIEDVGDRDDPPGEGDLCAGDSSWVAFAVPPLMVVPDRFGPSAEPFIERFHESFAGQRMLTKLIPLLISRLARFVENFRAHLELPDVV
jgi:hypothetical protein